MDLFLLRIHYAIGQEFSKIHTFLVLPIKSFQLFLGVFWQAVQLLVKIIPAT